MRILKECHRAEKCKRGDPLGFLKRQFVSKFQKKEGGPFGDIKKFSKKVPQCRKKIERGDPSDLSGFANAGKLLAEAGTRTRDR